MRQSLSTDPFVRKATATWSWMRVFWRQSNILPRWPSEPTTKTLCFLLSVSVLCATGKRQHHARVCRPPRPDSRFSPLLPARVLVTAHGRSSICTLLYFLKYYVDRHIYLNLPNIVLCWQAHLSQSSQHIIVLIGAFITLFPNQFNTSQGWKLWSMLPIAAI